MQRIADNIQGADVAALSFARNRDPAPRHALLDDLELWHVARYVFDWKAGAEHGSIEVTPDGAVEISPGAAGGPTARVVAAPGAELVTFAVGGVALSIPKVDMD